MSLKAFHIVFIVVSTLCALFSGAWGVAAYSRTGVASHLALGIGGFVVAVALVFYGFWFLRKLKDVEP